MSRVDEVVEAARKLSLAEREIVADRVLESLDGETLTEIDAAWLAEAETRYRRYRDGETKSVSLETVLGEIRGQSDQ